MFAETVSTKLHFGLLGLKVSGIQGKKSLAEY
jgi:hypothetical protein